MKKLTFWQRIKLWLNDFINEMNSEYGVEEEKDGPEKYS